MELFNIECSYWEYRNIERRLNKESKIFVGETIEEAFKSYSERRYIHDLNKNTQITIDNIFCK
ncbi:MAG: hypothetical protein RR255_00005 [Bacilli bacterium]